MEVDALTPSSQSDIPHQMRQSNPWTLSFRDMYISSFACHCTSFGESVGWECFWKVTPCGS
jgi:hypothetical protein